MQCMARTHSQFEAGGGGKTREEGWGWKNVGCPPIPQFANSGRTKKQKLTGLLVQYSQVSDSPCPLASARPPMHQLKGMNWIPPSVSSERSSQNGCLFTLQPPPHSPLEMPIPNNRRIEPRKVDNFQRVDWFLFFFFDPVRPFLNIVECPARLALRR